MLTVPSSSMLISQPDSSTRRLMFLPPGPIRAPIFSGLILTWTMRGAYLLSSGRGAAKVRAMILRMASRATRAFSNASVKMAMERPRSLRSNWNPVMPFSVPAILQSMSQKPSSHPRMSVSSL